MNSANEVMKKALLIAVRMYQVWLGPLLGGACRFYPSCSHYAVEAIERHGTGRGLVLAVRRVLRCHPFSAGGIDLVPEAEAEEAVPAADSAGAPAAFSEDAPGGARVAVCDANAAPAPREEFAQ